jgi:predicted DNA-binding transcriptional regulator YafY
MQASRLLSILLLLQLRGRVRAQALAEEFEVSVRTIYRDMDQLSAAGVPVYAERGREGGFQLLGNYRTALTGLNTGEAEALMLVGAGDAAAALGLPAANEARLKLLASLKPDEASRAEAIAARFHLDTEGWYGPDAARRWLPDLARAVWAERWIEIEYESWKSTVRRNLQPLGLVLKGSNWYLVAREEKSPHSYRVSNIRTLNVREKTFRRPARFDLKRYWAKASAAFEKEVLSAEADIAVSPLGLAWLRDVMPRAAAVMQEQGRAFGDEGWRRAKVPAEESRFATLRWLSFGSEILILGPARLKAAVKAEAAMAAKQHSA